MIIPIRCFTCNRVLASKYNMYIREREKISTEKEILSGDPEEDIIEKSGKNMEIFKKLGIDRYCCKRHLMTHINLISKV
jgi:DNA-directed RNA polymerase subunit N